jgi:hypothetical protein
MLPARFLTCGLTLIRCDVGSLFANTVGHKVEVPHGSIPLRGENGSAVADATGPIGAEVPSLGKGWAPFCRGASPLG